MARACLQSVAAAPTVYPLDRDVNNNFKTGFCRHL